MALVRSSATADPSGGIRGLAHLVAAQIFGIGVTDRVAGDDANAKPLDDASADVLDALLLEENVSRFSMLEVQLGIVSTALESNAEKVGENVVVDGKLLSKERGSVAAATLDGHGFRSSALTLTPALLEEGGCMKGNLESAGFAQNAVGCLVESCDIVVAATKDPVRQSLFL